MDKLYSNNLLIKGDCKNYIHFWEPTSDASWKVDTTPFIGHTASVEDLQVCFELLMQQIFGMP